MPVVVDINAAELEAMADALELDARDMQAAVKVAAARAARWARTQIARGLAARLGVPAALLSGRRIGVKSGRSGARVWIALNPLNAATANARSTGQGLRAGRETFAGAFYIKGRHGAGRAAVQRAGRGRKPLKAASLDVLAAADGAITRDAWPALNEKFLAFYAEELERKR